MSLLLRGSTMADKTTPLPIAKASKANMPKPIPPRKKSCERNADMEANTAGDLVDDVVNGGLPSTLKITKLSTEVLLLCIREMDLCTAISFGLANRVTYKAMKLVHPKPIGLMAKRVDTHIYPHEHSDQCYSNTSGEERLVCTINKLPPVLDTLVNFLLDPTTFKHNFATEYRLTHDRGDGKWMFLKKSRTGKTGAKEQELFDRYQDYGYFKKFDKEVEGHVRIPKRSFSTATDRPSLIPNPFGIENKAWVAAVVEVMIDDMGNWGRRGWWKKFWSNCYVFADNEKQLEEAAVKHEWKDIKVEDKQSAINEYMARATRKYNACIATGTCSRDGDVVERTLRLQSQVMTAKYLISFNSKYAKNIAQGARSFSEAHLGLFVRSHWNGYDGKEVWHSIQWTSESSMIYS
ncbi:hypothetical protein BDZ45DRAFT_776433 [Acephala macrosclerotiorum]|nr:hypothetical protein BDZ45DRAFT_776433 [Acephala macrosclerotiorum]